MLILHKLKLTLPQSHSVLAPEDKCTSGNLAIPFPR
jgi:hypothetical protein